MQRDDAYLLDMLLAAQRAAQHVSGIELEQFATSLLHQDAVIRELEIVGEAARRVSDPVKADHPAIDWAGIIGMRHRLVHDYRNIRVDIVWHVATHEVPLLVRHLEQIVPREDPEP